MEKDDFGRISSEFVGEKGWEERFLSLVGRFLAWRSVFWKGWFKRCRDPEIVSDGKEYFVLYRSDERRDARMSQGYTKEDLVEESFRYMFLLTGASSPEELEMFFSSEGF